MTCSALARGGVRVGLAVALCSVTVAARQSKPAAESMAHISGAVKSAADDAPVARARVLARADGIAEPRVAITGADGKYAFSDLPAGAYTLSVARTGFAPQVHGQTRQRPAVPIAVSAGQHLANIDFALVPGRSIAGRILDEDGTPFAGAIVDALVSRYAMGNETLAVVVSTETDDRGEFRLYGLAPGQYYVAASDPAFRNVMSPRGVQHYSPTYHPGVSAADQARPVVLTDSDVPPRIEFRLRLVPPARLSGHLVAETGKPLLNGAIILSPREGEGGPMVEAGDPVLLPDGRFSFGHVAPGTYQIRARGQSDSAEDALVAVFSVDVNGQDIADIQMTLHPGAQLDGRLGVEARTGVKPPRLATLRVRGPFANGSSFGDALSGAVHADGSFAVRGLLNGVHQIVVEGLPAPWVVKSVVYRGSDITDRQLDITGKEQLRDVRITITDVSGSVTGVVHNARGVPVASAGVLVLPQVPLFWMRTSRRLRLAYTDAEGRFTIPGLPAGAYVAVASMALDETDLGRRDRLQQLQAIGVPLHLATEDARASMTLQLADSKATPGVR